MNYRLYQASDFPQLYAIEEACFEPALRFSRGYMRSLVRSTEAVTWIAELDGQMAGFAIIQWSGEAAERVGYIQTLEIGPEFRRRGIGAELLRRLEGSAREAGAKQIWLHVDFENAAAIDLYRSAGFARQGRHASYYGGGRDAEIYCKAIE